MWIGYTIGFFLPIEIKFHLKNPPPPKQNLEKPGNVVNPMPYTIPKIIINWFLQRIPNNKSTIWIWGCFMASIYSDFMVIADGEFSWDHLFSTCGSNPKKPTSSTTLAQRRAREQVRCLSLFDSRFEFLALEQDAERVQDQIWWVGLKPSISMGGLWHCFTNIKNEGVQGVAVAVLLS